MALNPQVTDQGTKVKMTWTPDPSCQGYRFYVDGVAVSRTFKPDASSTTFQKKPGTHFYGIQKMDVVPPLEQVQFPAPPPPPAGSGDLGLCLNADPGAAWLAKAATLNPKYVREDTILQYKVDWAAAHNATFIGVCNLNSAGMAASLAKVNAWPQITLWELDNEPYFESVNVANWAQSALSLAQQIKAAHPGHQVILPMLIQTNKGDYNTGGSWSPWANQVLNAAPSLAAIVDFISGHAYSYGVSPNTPFQGTGPDAMSTLQTLDKVRGELVSKGVSKPWHITECGWSVGSNNGQVSAALQAQYLNELVVGLRSRSYIESIEVYCLQTWGSGYEQSFGLFNQDMSDRPSAQTYRNLN